MEFQIYNSPNCSLFDLMGPDEIYQTKGLGYLLAKSKEAMEVLLGMLFPKVDVLKYLKYDWTVCCEYYLDKDKADIIICFNDKGILKKPSS